MIRLIDLEPAWTMHEGRRVGLRYRCPCCRDVTLAILFENPDDGGDPHPDDEALPGNNGGRRWTRSGETFRTISVWPSIDASAASHWHGWVSSGELSP